MANDPRISGITDAATLPDVPDADVLNAKFVLIHDNDWADKSVSELLGALPPVEIWSAPSGRVTARSSTTIYTLNDGESFDNYRGVLLTYDNHGASAAVDTVSLSSFFPKGTYEVGDKIQAMTLNNWKEIRIESSTTFVINDGTSSLGIKSLYGFR